MKLLMIVIISFLLGATPASESKEDYLNEVDKAYSEYSYQEYSNEYYDIIIVEGIINGKVHQGIFFFNDVARSYNVYLINPNNKRLYYPKVTSRGDVSVVSLILDKDINYEITIFNKDFIQQSTFFEFTMEPKTVEEVKGSATHVGEDNGATSISLKLLKKPFNIQADWVQLLIAIAIGLIGICVFVIVYYKKRGKGMFAIENKTENIFNFREFIDSNNFDENISDTNSVHEKYLGREHAPDLDEDPTKETYKRYYRNVEEEYSGYDIKGYLISKNLSTEFSGLDSIEKNRIMLELMTLKNKGIITNDDYLEETMKLWKESD